MHTTQFLTVLQSSRPITAKLINSGSTSPCTNGTSARLLTVICWHIRQRVTVQLPPQRTKAGIVYWLWIVYLIPRTLDTATRRCRTWFP